MLGSALKWAINISRSNSARNNTQKSERGFKKPAIPLIKIFLLLQCFLSYRLAAHERDEYLLKRTKLTDLCSEYCIVLNYTSQGRIITVIRGGANNTMQKKNYGPSRQPYRPPICLCFPGNLTLFCEKFRNVFLIARQIINGKFANYFQ